MKPFEIWNEVNGPEDRNFLESLLHEYHAKPYEELCNLPEVTVEKMKSDQRKRRINIYRNKLEEGIIEIILQMYIPGRNFILIKLAQVESAGFRVLPNGETRDIPKEILYGYM